ncbi:MAG: hypothetical protein ACT4OX_05890 [Actinomycetota bacterium]
MTASARRVLCTIAHGPYRELLEITGPALERYAARHNYELLVVDRRIAPGRPAAWEKIALLHSLVAQPGIVCWIDADACVLDDAPDIEGALTAQRFLHLVEHRIHGHRIPNSGVMVLRGGPRASRFLERVWHHAASRQHPWWVNAAIIRLLGYRLAPQVRPIRLTVSRLGTGLLDRAWNSIPDDPAPVPRIAHFPGWPISQRLDALRRIARGA